MNSPGEPTTTGRQPSQRLRRKMMWLLLLVVAAVFFYARYQKSQMQSDTSAPPLTNDTAASDSSAIADGAAAYHSHTEQLPNPYGKDSEWAANADVATTSAGGDQTEVYLDARVPKQKPSSDGQVDEVNTEQ